MQLFCSTAATGDPLENALEVDKNLSFPVAWGVERDTGNKLGSFWDEKRNFMQPTEFVVTGSESIISSTYSSSPIGRTDPEEALVLLKFVTSAGKNNLENCSRDWLSQGSRA
ncbi:MAG: hypothetical protein CMQ19_04725 [Gammaproteobacteria bacterium]|nr:hypothetical protein [Gammaproteobacteria bacterium]